MKNIVVGRTKSGIDIIGKYVPPTNPDEEGKVVDIFWIFDEMTIDGWKISLRPYRSMFFTARPDGSRIIYSMKVSSIENLKKLEEYPQDDTLKKILYEMYDACSSIDTVTKNKDTNGT